jgi:hypothetical protein
MSTNANPTFSNFPCPAKNCTWKDDKENILLHMQQEHGLVDIHKGKFDIFESLATLLSVPTLPSFLSKSQNIEKTLDFLVPHYTFAFKGSLTLENFKFLNSNNDKEFFGRGRHPLFIGHQQFGQMFLLISEKTVQNDCQFFKFVVQLIGTREEARKFKYK